MPSPEPHRQTHRHTDTHRHTHTHTQTDRQTDTHTHTHTHAFTPAPAPRSATVTSIGTCPLGCVTGDSDGRMRTWGYDFGEHRLEVVHAHGVAAVDVDGKMRCLSTVGDGTLGEGFFFF